MQNPQQLFEEAAGPKYSTLQPIVTGTSVLSLKYKDGVMICADTQACYGSLARYKTFPRIAKINEQTAIGTQFLTYSMEGSGGEMSDFQELKKLLLEKNWYDSIQEDQHTFYSPKEYANYLSRRVTYQRNKLDPLLNNTIVGGVYRDQENKLVKYLGMVDYFGTLIEDNYLLTGLSLYFCQVLMAHSWRDDMSEQEAKDLLEQCMTVLFYRDKSANDIVQICKITESGVQIEEPHKLKTQWDFKFFKEVTNEKLQELDMK